MDGKAAAIVKYVSRDTVDNTDKYDQHTVEGKVAETTDASGISSDARVNVTIYDDGRFLIEYGAVGVTGNYAKNEVSTTRCHSNAFGCNPSSSSNSDSAQPKNLGGAGGTIHGKVDPAKPNALAGSLSEPASLLASGPPGQSIVSWTLKR